MPPQLMLVATTGCPGCSSLGGPSLGALLLLPLVLLVLPLALVVLLEVVSVPR
jgi:hypothetical protein